MAAGQDMRQEVFQRKLQLLLLKCAAFDASQIMGEHGGLRGAQASLQLLEKREHLRGIAPLGPCRLVGLNIDGVGALNHTLL